MTTRKSLPISEREIENLTTLAKQLHAEYRGKPSWRRLVRLIACGAIMLARRPANTRQS